MSGARQGVGGYPVQIEDIFLQGCAFEDLRTSPDDSLGESLTLETSYRFILHNPRRLMAVLRINLVSDVPTLRLEVTYAGDFSLLEDAEGDPERIWRNFSAEVIPGVLFPFARELVASLTCRSRVEPILVPLSTSMASLKPERVRLLTYDLAGT